MDAMAPSRAIVGFVLWTVLVATDEAVSHDRSPSARPTTDGGAEESTEGLAATKNNLGIMLQRDAERGIDHANNLHRAMTLFQEALVLLNDKQDSPIYAGVLTNLGNTYRMRSEWGVESRANSNTREAPCRKRRRFISGRGTVWG